MGKLLIYLINILLVSSLIQCNDDKKKGTVGIYVSPHGITRQTEVHQSLLKIADKIKIAETVYTHGNTKYTIKNATCDMVFLDGKQLIEINDKNQVKVSGGRIQFEYAFNFTKQDQNSQVQGWAYGYVVSQSFNYSKELFPLQDGHTKWTLVPGQQGYTKLSIGQRMKIKRMEPYNQVDYQNIQGMLDRAFQAITPSNIQTQLLSEFNNYMPSALNESLHASNLQPQFEYKFHSSTHGEIGMNITNSLWGFSVDEQKGYQIIYLSEIKGQGQPCIDQYVLPEEPLGFKYYGGHQTIISNCFYDYVLQYINKKGWLDVSLNNQWDCNAFQFYAGDLYQLLPTLYKVVNPRQPLEGDCKITSENLKLKHQRDQALNVYKLQTDYVCNIHSSNKQGQKIDILKFHPKITYLISSQAAKNSILFNIYDADITEISFETIGDFNVKDTKLAIFSIKQILQKIKHTPVFGNGYPLNAKQYPKTEIRNQFVIYFDAHSSSQSNDYIEEQQ